MHTVHAKQTGRSVKGCWTCKRRKIGCDKSLPGCNNCTRACRFCEGYGLKIQWPENSTDRRRPIQKWEMQQRELMLSRRCAKYYFLNTTYRDFSLSWHEKVWVKVILSRPQQSLPFGFENNIQGKEGILISYYQKVLSRMITTIDDGLNGFRTVLLPSALSEASAASQSLQKSILALSAFHLWGHDASVPYKLSAIQLLSRSIQDLEESYISQFATCMMLCVCDVFDSADGSWLAHLNAANFLSSRLSLHKTESNFLLPWLAYHSVLAKFSKCHIPDTEITIPHLPRSKQEDMIVIGSLGCSLQVLNCISCIIDLSNLLRRASVKILAPEFRSYPGLLLKMLQGLEQRPMIMEDTTSGRVDAGRVRKTAELYRTATEIYLHRAVFRLAANSLEVQRVVRSGLGIIHDLGTCTSPWPMFVIACEVAEEKRVEILDAIEKMQSERRIGNIAIMRSIVEACWKRSDLGDWNGDWREMMSPDGRLPSFI